MSVRLHLSVSISGAESPKAPVPLGMESGAIFDSQITASSMFNDKHAAPNARLHFKGSENPLKRAGWVAGVKNINQWLQVKSNKKPLTSLHAVKTCLPDVTDQIFNKVCTPS